MVKSSSQVVDHVASGGKRIERLHGKPVHILDALAMSLRITLGQNHVHLLSPKIQEAEFEITEMLLGPLDFYSNKNKSVVGRECHTTG
jgi:hypothetical protein